MVRLRQEDFSSLHFHVNNEMRVGLGMHGETGFLCLSHCVCMSSLLHSTQHHPQPAFRPAYSSTRPWLCMLHWRSRATSAVLKWVHWELPSLCHFNVEWHGRAANWGPPPAPAPLPTVASRLLPYLNEVNFAFFLA